jgi:TonB family protein
LNKLETDVRVALVSKDAILVDSLTRKLLDTDDDNQARMDIQFSSEPETIGDPISLDIVIYDLDTVDGDLQKATLNILEYKNINPSIRIVLIGGRKDIASALALERIAPLIERTLSKPLVSGQLLITIGMVSQQINHGLIDQSAPKAKRLNFLRASIATVLLIAVIFFLLDNSKNQKIIQASLSEVKLTTSASQKLASIAIDSTENRNADIIFKLALSAQNEGKLIIPKGKNALFFLNHVLDIDPYHEGAYRAKLGLLEQLRLTFPQSLSLSNFEQADRIIEALIDGDPFNKENGELRKALNRTIDRRPPENGQFLVASKSEQLAETVELAEAARPVNKLLLALDNEENQNNTLDAIYGAIKVGNLIPPNTNSAYSLLIKALLEKSLTEVSLDSAQKALASELIQAAKQNLVKSELTEASNKIKYIRNLDSDHSQLPELRSMLISKRNSKVIDKEMMVGGNGKPPSTSIELQLSTIPFKVVSRVKAAYPKRALKFDIEGWVEVEYQVSEAGRAVNINVVDAEPKGVFEKSAIKAIKKWRFSPSVDSATGQPVLSKPTSSKFNFSLRS